METDNLSTNAAPAENVDPGMASMLAGFGIGNEPEPEAEADTPTTPEGDPQGTDGADNTGDAAAETDAPNAEGDSPEHQRANQAFAEMRSRNAAYSKFIKHMMTSAGYTGTEDEYIKMLTDQAYVASAKRQNVADPAILKRLDTLEHDRATLVEQNNKNLFTANAEKLKAKYNLTGNELEAFVRDAHSRGINLLEPGVDFTVLYQGLYHDKIIAKQIEDERQKWLAAQTKGQTEATTPDGKKGKDTPAPTDVNTMAEFTSLLSNLPK